MAGGGETKDSISGWTVDTLAEHHRALREGDLRFEEERDRRYKEVAIERGKALDIKEKADENALRLDREIRDYKDEKANALREQLRAERLEYAQKGDLKAATEKIEETLKPIVSFVAQQQGRAGGLQASWAWIIGAIGAAAGIVSIVVVLTRQ